MAKPENISQDAASFKAMLDAAANGPLLSAGGHIPLVQRNGNGEVVRGGYELSSLAAAAIRKRGEG